MASNHQLPTCLPCFQVMVREVDKTAGPPRHSTWLAFTKTAVRVWSTVNHCLWTAMACEDHSVEAQVEQLRLAGYVGQQLLRAGLNGLGSVTTEMFGGLVASGRWLVAEVLLVLSKLAGITSGEGRGEVGTTWGVGNVHVQAQAVASAP